MEIFGLTIARTKALQLQAVQSRGGWWPLIRESFTGAWQSNIEVELTDVLSHPTVWSCITLIASDISKNVVRLVEETADGVWVEVQSPAFSPVLRKPNHYQTRINFFESWVISKLCHGNTYVLKQRDHRGVVVALYVLDPQRVKPLVTPDGGVYYELMRDDLSEQPQERIVVPAKEIIHDIHVPLYHPLVGVSPIYACGIAAIQGLRIQTNQTNLFVNGANPGGVLTAPGRISDETAARLKAYWDANFSGSSVGKVAVLGDNLKFEKMAMSAVDTELIKQLNWSDERICSCFHVPPYMVGVGQPPAYNNIEALARVYYSQCLQILFEKIELALDEGLGLLPQYGSEFDLDNLLRMDSATMMATIKEGVSAGVLKPNEGRRKLNYAPVPGGDTPYLQVQNYSLSALNRRDEAGPPPVTPSPSPAIEPAKALPEASIDIASTAGALFAKAFAELERPAA
jgi:HK97 family phage portal protein